jgi:hypothetical protein
MVALSCPKVASESSPDPGITGGGRVKWMGNVKVGGDALSNIKGRSFTHCFCFPYLSTKSLGNVSSGYPLDIQICCSRRRENRSS